MFSKFFQTIGVVFLVCVLFGQPAAGQKPGGQQPGGHLRIDEVLVDFTLETITITGEDFDFGGYLEVTLGQVPGDITGLCTPFPTTTIVCDFSGPGLPLDGDYLLTVATGVGQSQSDEYDLTIGAAAIADLQAQIDALIDQFHTPTCPCPFELLPAQDPPFQGSGCFVVANEFLGIEEYFVASLNTFITAQSSVPGALCDMNIENPALAPALETTTKTNLTPDEAATCLDLLTEVANTQGLCL